MAVGVAVAFSDCAHADGGEPFKESLPYFQLLQKDDAALAAQGLHREAVGDLNLPTGRILAMDPLTLSGIDSGFSQTVLPGKYPVSIYWVEKPDWGKRVAFAAVKFADGDPASWRMAVGPTQDASKLKGDEIYGYGVDAGLGAFLSPEGFQSLSQSMDKAAKDIANFSDYYTDVLAKDLDKTAPSRLLYAPPAAPDANVAMFESGFGDGFYPSYFGLDAAGKPLVLVTTFFVLDAPPQEQAPATQPEKAN